MCVCDAGASASAQPWDLTKPMLTTNHPAVARWTSDAKAQLAMCSYASAYKKDSKLLKTMKTQALVPQGAGKAQYMKMWSEVLGGVPVALR
eukprot:11823702-Alexandrium_andersonii.AAC.1